ncbi:MAG: alpha/beta hydrolase [Planctomycetota bacterium]
MTERTVWVRGDEVPVTIVEPATGTLSGQDLLFLHGYARRPLDYRLFLEELAERGRRVVAPFIYANNGLRHTPRHFWTCAGLTLRTCEALVAEGTLQPGAVAVGHSTGGAVTLTLGRLDPQPRALLAFNPVQPSSRSPVEFMARSLWMNTKLFLGLAGEGRRARKMLSSTTLDFYGNWLRDPRASTELIGGLRAYDYEALARWYEPNVPCAVPARVIYGRGDEFYPSVDGLADGLGRLFATFDLVVLDDQNSHEWMMIRPDRAADELDRFAEGALA